ncbi:MAG: hypothetical protein J0H83_08555 [Candidatus Melainabacteria bacterium]|jgi:hypothetical protein|nr:hypothetical protein [Candidatus Melainabacteria bacterium]MBX9674026.1 hypothetical protein [Candidatus Obscuribacterales bacterium]
MSHNKDAMTQSNPSQPDSAKPCRHEYVRIYQRKLKGIERRMTCTRAFLPIGFKLGDFNHLSEGSFCFCSKCRVRLYPKRTNAEKEQARLAARAGREAEFAAGADLIEEVGADVLAEVLAEGDLDMIEISVDEMETIGVDAQDIANDGVKIESEEGDNALADDEVN